MCWKQTLGIPDVSLGRGFFTLVWFHIVFVDVISSCLRNKAMFVTSWLQILAFFFTCLHANAAASSTSLQQPAIHCQPLQLLQPVFGRVAITANSSSIGNVFSFFSSLLCSNHCPLEDNTENKPLSPLLFCLTDSDSLIICVLHSVCVLKTTCAHETCFM